MTTTVRSLRQPVRRRNSLKLPNISLFRDAYDNGVGGNRLRAGAPTTLQKLAKFLGDDTIPRAGAPSLERGRSVSHLVESGEVVASSGSRTAREIGCGLRFVVQSGR
jgi:hypothetical protein